jgi:putative transposase
MALRQPAEGLVHHSDRGSQYTSGDYLYQLSEAGLLPPFSRPGDCWDNAVAERFFGTLKTELIHR